MFIFKVILLTILCHYNIINSSELNITIVLEHNKKYNIKVNNDTINKYKILTYFKNYNKIEKFKSDKYYLTILKDVIDSLKIYLDNKNINCSNNIKNKKHKNELNNNNNTGKRPNVNKSKKDCNKLEQNKCNQNDNESQLYELFLLIFDDIIIKVIRTYRFIFNNINGKLSAFYNKYCNNLNKYNDKLDKIYEEFKNILA